MDFLLELGGLMLGGLVLPFEKTVEAAYEQWLENLEDTSATAVRGIDLPSCANSVLQRPLPTISETCHMSFRVEGRRAARQAGNWACCTALSARE